MFKEHIKFMEEFYGIDGEPKKPDDQTNFLAEFHGIKSEPRKPDDKSNFMEEFYGLNRKSYVERGSSLVSRIIEYFRK